MWSLLYNDIIYRPILNLLVFLYNIIPGHDIGIVIILVTILIRLLLAPSFHKSLKSQQAMNQLQPKLNEVRQKYKDNQQEQAKAMMALYKEYKISPFSSCLPLLLQLPILIALYQVFIKALRGNLDGLYSYISRPAHISPISFHFIDLTRAVTGGAGLYIPALVLAILAGASQYWQSKLMMPNAGGQDATVKAMRLQTTYILPLVSAFIALRLPAGLPLYWVISTLFAVAQQYYIMRKQQSAVGNN
jgi:YidC/Oxa1 family membrane protein insertase